MKTSGVDSISVKESDTIRFFVFWVGGDLDISGRFLNESRNTGESIVFSTLKSRPYSAVYSGDATGITGSGYEYIDLTLNAYEKGCRRYFLVNVSNFFEVSLNDSSYIKCGFMLRNYPALTPLDVGAALHSSVIESDSYSKNVYELDLLRLEVTSL